ncbi:MAG: carbon starvation protein A [Bacteroidales bacterium]|nr:carbon starvation protein A [Bacteroidales bacterium]
MYSFLISVALLVIGYLLYGRFVERVFGPDPNRPTPAISKADGIDYIAMPTWKVFMIQLLNIAGTGPIFGAILGAQFGPACYLWIVIGCIFGGAVHDYLSGMLSVKHGGEGLPGLIGFYLGNRTKAVMLAFSVLMLMLVGAVFVYSPAKILGGMTGGTNTAVIIWVFVVLAYYIIATLVPIDKIIGRIYPVFAIALILMAVSLMVCLLAGFPSGLPEVWDGLQNRSPQSGSLFPCLFISVACGAVSGFHATQSPLMARCMKNEKLGRPIFYGAMITEGLIALIWAAVASYFFFAGGAEKMGVVLTDAVASDAPGVVNTVSKYWLGSFGSILVLLGVVAAPITSGDTALRSARLIVADALHLDQKSIGKRLAVSLPIFAVTGLLLCFNILNAKGFGIIWRYFGWANQTLSVFTFWALTVFLAKHRKGLYYLITLIPGCFMTAVCVTFICTAKIGLNMPEASIPWLASGVTALCLTLFYTALPKIRKES